MKLLDLFAGIGGFSLGMNRAGIETAALVEIDPYCRRVLKKHWSVPVYNDVREVTKHRLESDGITGIDIISAGFPCTDISAAGTQTGLGAGTRSGLWAECPRLLGELRPRYGVFENVTALLTGNRGQWFQQVLWELSQIGFDAEWHCIPASALGGAQHRRDRVWIIATNTNAPALRIEQRRRESGPAAPITGIDGNPKQMAPGPGACADTFSQRLERIIQSGPKTPTIDRSSHGDNPRWWGAEPGICRILDGVPNRVDRLRSLGNAIVPPMAEIIGRAIMEADNE